MGAVLNGLALDGLRPFGSSFLIFSDYMRPPMRLAALMRLPVIYVFTHDSIGLGEDGPTHQPVEQLIGLRAVPGLIVIRPADANEVVEAWRVIIGLKDAPACLVLSRQPLPTLDRNRYAAASGLARGGYILADAAGRPPDVILIGTGSEVATLCGGGRDACQGKTSRRAWSVCRHGSCSIGRMRLSRERIAESRQGAGLGRSRFAARLGAICRARRRYARHASIWRLGADEGPDEAFRLYCRTMSSRPPRRRSRNGRQP